MVDGVDFIEADERPLKNPDASKEEQAKNWKKVSAKMHTNLRILANGRRAQEQRYGEWAASQKNSLVTPTANLATKEDILEELEPAS